MPVRSLTSYVFIWPKRAEVVAAARRWTETLAATGNVLAVGYVGSYAREEDGVGSDLDLLVLVSDHAQPFARRTPSGLETLPVPAEALVYTEAEWEVLERSGSRFARTLRREVRWLFDSA